MIFVTIFWIRFSFTVKALFYGEILLYFKHRAFASCYSVAVEKEESGIASTKVALPLLKRETSRKISSFCIIIRFPVEGLIGSEELNY